ncbi:flagellar hook-length control protein FliK [Marinobacter sp. 1Y8]
MKLPDSGQPRPTPEQTPATRPSSTTAGNVAGEPLDARQLLDQLKLRQSQQVLAKVTQVLEKTSTLPEQLLLDVRGKPLVVNSDAKLQPGDWLTMVRIGNELRLMEQLQGGNTPQARIAQQLAQHLPWQHRLDQGLAQLAQLLNNSASPASPLQQLNANALESVRSALQSLVQHLPKAGELTPGNNNDPIQALRKWVQDSGLFAESRLTRSPEGAQTDLKLALGRVVASLLAAQGEQPEAFNRYTPLTSGDLVQSPLQFPQAVSAQMTPARQDNMTTGQMLRLLAGMLNRITVNQLHSQTLTTRTTADGPAAPTWLLELPWVDTQEQTRTAQMRLERHDPDDANQSQHARRKVTEWRLTLSLDLDEAGAVTFEASLQHQQISTRIWADKTDTLRQANEELPALRKRLTELGLEVVELECRRGQPQTARTQLDHRLVDIKA